MIETAATRARHVRNHAVHNLAAFFVGVEILIKKEPQKASALGNPNGINALHWRGSLRIIFQKRKKIPDCYQPYSHHGGIFAAIHHFINLAGNETGVYMDEMWIGREFPIYHMGKTPIAARNLCAGCSW